MEFEPVLAETRGTLHRLEAGDAAASDELFAQLYGRLRGLASNALGPAGRQVTLQPTALVHEVWLRLGADGELRAESRQHFLRLAARAMRAVVVDHARKRGTAKRDAGRERVPLDDALEAWAADGALDPLELDELLAGLREQDERLADVVDLRFFGGLTEDEVAAALELTPRQVQHAWKLARAWLARELERGEADPS